MNSPDQSVLENYIAIEQEKLEQFPIPPTSDYDYLYSLITNQELKKYFITVHSIIVDSYRYMNSVFEKSDKKYYRADESRRLNTCISSLLVLQDKLKNTPFSFEIKKGYYDIFIETLNFITLQGSYIPPNWGSVQLPLRIQLFTENSTMKISHISVNTYARLTYIGEGAFATVYKCFDEFLNRDIAIKEAKVDLEEKEIERFENEFKLLCNLDSPYIVDVYSYNANKKSYTMEYMPYNFYKYNELHNPSPEVRRKIALQILSASEYIVSKGLFHRDLSPNNVLIKDYEDGSVVAKLSDFGLVKNPDFQLTSFDTNPKGTFIAPELSNGHISFKQYSIKQEVYALTRLLFFIITGQYAPDKNTSVHLQKAYNTGTHNDPDQRPDNIATVKALYLERLT